MGAAASRAAAGRSTAGRVLQAEPAVSVTPRASHAPQAAAAASEDGALDGRLDAALQQLGGRITPRHATGALARSVPRLSRTGAKGTLRADEVRSLFAQHRDAGTTAAELARTHAGVNEALLSAALRAASLPRVEEVEIGGSLRRVAVLASKQEEQ